MTAWVRAAAPLVALAVCGSAGSAAAKSDPRGREAIVAYTKEIQRSLLRNGANNPELKAAKGRLDLQFTILADGRTANFQIKRRVGANREAEAVARQSVAAGLPPIPRGMAKQMNIAVPVWFD
ncbi:energy transducer TonB [Terrihabitans rhizophilus]|uniref:Energy transducer TonB n=1 Tax=Terrihabitans rhizophilus TaxID=3092662 RepID=A0ABU4RQK6_9HYPH|nr:energy transducer TonB [Terrihabitans sp. PJ23]MDX6807139.1 energy transducer TonB [Terrihabitans sp. PJ23]